MGSPHARQRDGGAHLTLGRASTGDRCRWSATRSGCCRARRRTRPGPRRRSPAVWSVRSPRPGPDQAREFAGIRAFAAGDRLRLINWRVSARTGQLHVTTTRSEQDAGILLVVDATTDHGRSGGVDGTASSLDLTVRAAASIAEHAVRRGDRAALRVISGDGPKLGFASGRGQLGRRPATLAVVRPSGLAEGYETRLRLEAPEGDDGGAAVAAARRPRGHLGRRADHPRRADPGPRHPATGRATGLRG